MSILQRSFSISSLSLVIAALLTAGPAAAAGPTKDLVAHYCFNTSLVADCSSAGNNGVATGSVSLDKGVLGQAAKFGGYQNLGYISVPASPSLTLNNAFTISYWVRLDSFAGEDAFAQFVPFATQIAVAKSHDRAGLFSYIGATGPTTGNVGLIDYGTAAFFASPITPQLGKWVHIAFTHSTASDRDRLYVDGRLMQTIEGGHYNFATAAGQPLYLGAQSPLSGERTYRYPLAGALDEVRIYKRELSQIELFLTVLSDRLGIKN